MGRVSFAFAILITILFCFDESNGSSTREVSEQGVKFVDVARSSGLFVMNVNGAAEKKTYIIESTGSGIASFDYNNDGYPDIFIVNGTTLDAAQGAKRPISHLLRNNRDGTFTDVTRGSGLDHSGWGQGVCVGDYDNDGWLDLFVTYYGTNVLYHNNGDGTFSDVTRRSGLTLDHVNYSTGCAFLDYDRDGRLDLFVASYVDFDLNHAPLPGSSSTCRWKSVPVYCGPRGLPVSRSHLFHNKGDGTFADVSERAGIWNGNQGYGFAVAAADLWNRGWPDIFVACDSTPSLLYRNNTDGTFSEVGVTAGVAYSDAGVPQAGMGAAVGDYDNDGYLDIFKTNFVGDISDLFHSNHDGTFDNLIFRAGGGQNTQFLGLGVGFIDYDNDGWKDIFIANGHMYPEIEAKYPDERYRQRKILYHNLGNGRFRDVSLESGPGTLLKKCSRGVAFADFDNDGNMDVLINNINDFPTLLKNEGGNRNHWIEIKTVGTKSNRAGIGTRVEVVTGGHAQVDEVRSGGSYLSQSDLSLHFGVGRETKIDLLDLRWPSGMVDQIRNLAADGVITVKEGVGVVARSVNSHHP
jgi:hypothetical protein